MLEPGTILIITLTFLLAGIIKGIIGLGLPTVSLALLTLTVGLPNAMALLLIPSFITNLWQAITGGHGRTILILLWPFLLMATVTVWIGAFALTRVDVMALSALLGILLTIYALINLTPAQVTVSVKHEKWLGPVAGILNGLFTGMTGSFVVPGVLYLQALGLPRDQLIQAMGMLFTASTLALAIALGGNHLLTVELGTISGAAAFPAIIGMMLGQRVRRRLSEPLFKRIFFLSLLILGTYITASVMRL